MPEEIELWRAFSAWKYVDRRVKHHTVGVGSWWSGNSLDARGPLRDRDDLLYGMAAAASTCGTRPEKSVRMDRRWQEGKVKAREGQIFKNLDINVKTGITEKYIGSSWKTSLYLAP
jgi:hypothetical protein